MAITAFLKRILRDTLPGSWQVTVKYQYNRFRGFLEPELEFLDLWVRPGTRVVDVGANLGVYTLRLAKLGAKVQSFEPNQACASVLEAWASRQSSVFVHRFALSDSKGELSLNIPVDSQGVTHTASASLQISNSGSFVREQVKVRTLDSFQFQDVSFVKIDVEGHELPVLRGSVRLLQESRPVLQVEIEQRHNNGPISDIFSWVKGFSYSGFFYYEGGFLPLQSFDPSVHQIVERVAGKRFEYVNNFIFIPTEELESTKFEQFLSLVKTA